MFVAMKDSTRRRLDTQICTNFDVHARFGAYLRDEAMPNQIPWSWHEHWNYPKEYVKQSIIAGP